MEVSTREFLRPPLPHTCPAQGQSDQTQSGIAATIDVVWHLELEINKGAPSSLEDDFYTRIQRGFGGGGRLSALLERS